MKEKKKKEEGFKTTTAISNLLARKSPIEVICEQLERTHVDLEELNRRFLREHKWYPLDKGNASGKAAELYVVMAIEKIQRAGSTINPLFMTEEIKREVYRYSPVGKASYNVLVRKRGSNKPVDEIDLVVMQGGLPIIIETRISRYSAGKNGSSICDMVSERNMRKKQEEIAKLVGKCPEIVVVIPQDCQKKLTAKDSCLRRYMEKRGYVVFFPYDRHVWQEKIQQFMRRQWRKREMTDAPENESRLRAAGNPHPSSLSLPSRRSYI